MSVFALRRKTNNDMEIYNRWIKKTIQSNHPNIFRYLDYTLSKQLEDCFEDEGSIDEDAVITQERPLCPVCRDVEKTVNTTFVPCGHTNCFDCASAIKNTGQHCPICRQSISDIMRVIFS